MLSRLYDLSIYYYDDEGIPKEEDFPDFPVNQSKAYIFLTGLLIGIIPLTYDVWVNVSTDFREVKSP